MRMLIKTLKLENFRQFKGYSVVNFSYDPEKNVTIILGDNTYGKTTILQAFNWCFYGEVVFSHRRDFLLNCELELSMKSGDEHDVSVEIVILHDGIEYTIKRTQTYGCMYEGVVRGSTNSPLVIQYKQPDGQMKSIPQEKVKNVINTILPEDFSEYFFFDTERISSISTRKDVASAVKGLMGITYMTKAISHLGDIHKERTVIGKMYSSMDLEGNEKANEALKAIHEAENTLEVVKESLNECNTQINHYEARKEQLDSILRNNQLTAQIQKQKEKIEKDIEFEKKELARTVAHYFKEFSTNSLPFFAQPLIRKTLSFLKEVKIDDKGVRDLTRSTIIELINRGKCICGQEIHEGNEAYKNLMNELNFVPPESIGNAVRHYRERLNIFSKNADSSYSSLEQHFKSILRSKNRIQDYEDKVVELSEQIAGKDDMRKYEEELTEVRKQLRDLDSKRQHLNRDYGATLSEIERNQKIFDSLTSVSDKNQETMKLISYAEKVRDWFDEKCKEKELNIREELETKVNEIFEKMYHGNCRVSIDQKYNTELLTVVSNRVIPAGESEGSNRVKNFAFIAGLVSLAREKISSSNKNDLDLSSEPYPLVMDAPFSNTDETHITNISKVLPDTAEQIIMFVMQKDWNYAEPVMASRIGQKYILKKDSETCTRFTS